MAQCINITLPPGEEIYDGKLITFKVPCNNTGITTLNIRRHTDNTYVAYSLVDAMGESVANIINAFTSDSIISVLLDSSDKIAVIQNASYAIAKSHTINISSSNWTQSNGNYIYKYTISELNPDRDIVHIGLNQSDDYDTAELQREAFGCINRVAVSNGYLTFIAPYDKPSINLSISIEVIRK